MPSPKQPTPKHEPSYEPIHERVGKRLRSLRKRKGWKLAYVEAQSGLDVPHLSRIETGKLEPTLRVLEMLADVYGVTLAELFREI